MTHDSTRRSLPVGKLPAHELQALVGRLPRHDARVLVGPAVGEDAAVIDLGDRLLVAATDPVTFATDRIGWYAVHVNANDVAVLGARPRWFFLVLLLPEGSATAELARAIAADVAATCDALGVTVCGGHTEITAGLDRPVVVGQMLGEVDASRVILKPRLRPGDQVLLTRGVAIEGTALLARERPEALRGRVPDAVLARAAGLLTDPGISVVDAALAAADAGARAMHDLTEGGVLAGLCELAASAGTGLRVFGDRIPVYDETRRLADALDLDPLALLASGALLVGTAPADVAAIQSALATRGIPATVVAEARPPAAGLVLVTGGRETRLVPPARDEIARIFESGR